MDLSRAEEEIGRAVATSAARVRRPGTSQSPSVRISWSVSCRKILSRSGRRWVVRGRGWQADASRLPSMSRSRSSNWSSWMREQSIDARANHKPHKNQNKVARATTVIRDPVGRGRLRLKERGAERGGPRVAPTLRPQCAQFHGESGSVRGNNVQLARCSDRLFPLVRARTTLRPRQDSNLRTRLRRPLLYPLSYGGWTPSTEGPAIVAATSSRSPPRWRPG